MYYVMIHNFKHIVNYKLKQIQSFIILLFLLKSSYSFNVKEFTLIILLHKPAVAVDYLDPRLLYPMSILLFDH